MVARTSHREPRVRVRHRARRGSRVRVSERFARPRRRVFEIHPRAIAATPPRDRVAASSPDAFAYQELFELAEPKDIPWRKITSDHVSVHEVMGRRVLKVEPEALRLVAQEGMTDIAHLLRPGHLQQLRQHPRRPRGV